MDDNNSRKASRNTSNGWDANIISDDSNIKDTSKIRSKDAINKIDAVEAKTTRTPAVHRQQQRLRGRQQAAGVLGQQRRQQGNNCKR
jgi:hypothetical protein